MPVTKTAKRALRTSMLNKAINDQTKKVLKEEVKKVVKLVKTDTKEAKKELSKAYSVIDKAAKNGVIKKNTASRRKAQLSRMTK